MSAEPSTLASGRASGGHLLVVDDNALDRERLGQRLVAEGYTVELAASGAEALALLRAEPCELLLLDSLMPEMDGAEVLRVMKRDLRLRDIPVIMISGLDEIDSVAKCIEAGAADYVPSPFDPVLLRTRIQACLENRRLREQEALFLSQLKLEKEHSDRLINVVIPIGVALMHEPDYNRLLEKILIEAKVLCNADGGTLYLVTEGRYLKFVILRNDSLGIELGGTSAKPIPFPPLNLYNPDTGKPNHNQVACHVALTGESVNIPDAYNVAGFDFHGTKAFDQRTGYRSTSFLTVPLKDRSGSVIGVLQLINALEPATQVVIPFDPSLQQSVESLSVLAAAALESYGNGLRPANEAKST